MDISIELTEKDREQLEEGFPTVWYFGDPPGVGKITVQFTKGGI